MFLFRCCCGDQPEYTGEAEPLVVENYLDAVMVDITGLDAKQAYAQAQATGAPRYQRLGHEQVYLLHDTTHAQQGVYTVGIPDTATADFFGYALYSYKNDIFKLHTIACEPKKTGLGGILMHKVMEVAQSRGVTNVAADAQGTPEFYVKYYPPLKTMLDLNKQRYGKDIGGKFLGGVNLPVNVVLANTTNNAWVRM